MADANYTLETAIVFPDGTTVGAYRAEDQVAGSAFGTIPPNGTAVDSQIAIAGSVTFTLPTETQYIAAAQVGGVWRQITFEVPGPSTVDPSGAIYLADFAGGLIANDPSAATYNSDLIDTAKATISGGVPSIGTAYPGNMDNRLGKVVVPRGQFYVDRTIEIDRYMILEGQGSYGWAPASEFLFPADTLGLWVRYIQGTSAGHGDWATVRDLGIKGHGGTDDTAHGILMHARARIENVAIHTFAGNGISVEASSPVHNANNVLIRDITIYGCGGDGIYFEGGDSNAGHIVGVDSSSNGGYGFNDNSFLGNTYDACHASGNTSGSYHSPSGGVNATRVNDCYSEGGGCDIGHPGSVVNHIGGNNAGDGSEISGSAQQGWRVTPSIRATNELAAGNPYVQLAAQDANVGTVLSLGNEDNEIEILNHASYGGTKVLALTQGFSGDIFGYLVMTTDSNSRGKSWFKFPRGYLVGTRTIHQPGAAAPVAGAWEVGDITWNSAPTAGGTIGWVCTSAGSPGTWKTFGAIAA